MFGLFRVDEFKPPLPPPPKARVRVLPIIPHKPDWIRNREYQKWDLDIIEPKEVVLYSWSQALVNDRFVKKGTVTINPNNSIVERMRFCQMVDDNLQNSKLLGQGVFGKAYLNSDKVVKEMYEKVELNAGRVVFRKDRWMNKFNVDPIDACWEYEVMKILSTNELCPRPTRFVRCPSKFYVEMEAIPNTETFYEWLVKHQDNDFEVNHATDKLLKKVYSMNRDFSILHKDLHLDNVLVQKNKDDVLENVFIIDFGMATSFDPNSATLTARQQALIDFKRLYKYFFEYNLPTESFDNAWNSMFGKDMKRDYRALLK